MGSHQLHRHDFCHVRRVASSRVCQAAGSGRMVEMTSIVRTEPTLYRPMPTPTGEPSEVKEWEREEPG
jgi:hypothetical protein